MTWINDTDSEWRRWGETDPYFAVLTSPRYRNRANTIEFFQTGESHFSRVRANYQRLGISLDPAGVALDFGCGVGRVLRPLCEYFKRAVGIDVSPAMLSEAGKQVTSPKVDLRLFDGNNLSGCLRHDTYQFIHSHIVFQHIRPRRGLIILRTLLSRLERKGKAYIHLPIWTSNKLKYLAHQIITSHPMFLTLSKGMLGKRDFRMEPVMQMNVYSAPHLLSLFAAADTEVRNVALTEDPKNRLTNASWYLYKL